MFFNKFLLFMVFNLERPVIHGLVRQSSFGRRTGMVPVSLSLFSLCVLCPKEILIRTLKISCDFLQF